MEKMSIFRKLHCIHRFSEKFVHCRNSFTVRLKQVNFSNAASEEKLVPAQENSVMDGKEFDIEKIRNKSRLRPEHRNILFNRRPYSEPVMKSHYTIKYNRKLYGKYGLESGVYPGIMWPSKTDIQERREFENVAYPSTIEEMVASARNEIEAREKEIQKKHDKVVANLAKLDTWKKELKNKIAKKEAEALAAKEKKDKLIEEVRRHFGFTVDPKDDRFKEMVTLKEKEQKKKERQARIEENEKKAVAKLMEKHQLDPSVINKTGET